MSNLDIVRRMAEEKRQSHPNVSLARQAAQRLNKKPMGQKVQEFFLGDDDPNTQNLGEKIGSGIHKFGESLTFGLVGDELNAAAESLLPGVNYEDRRDHYRQQEKVLERDNPGVALTADIAGALAGPGKFGAGVINAGKGLGRVGRGAMTGASAGTVHGTMEGIGGEEDLRSRALGGAVGAATGGVAGGALTGLGEGFNAALRRLQTSPKAPEVVPTLENLRDTAAGLYKRAEGVQVLLPTAKLSELAQKAQTGLKSDGYHPRLHPRIKVVLREIDAMQGSDKSLMELEQLRRIAQNAGQSLQPDERRLAGTLVDQIDDAIEELGSGSAPLREAREVWGRFRRLQMLEDLVEDASNSPNFEQAVQSKVRALLRNQKRMRGFSEAERRALKEITSGEGSISSLQNVARVLSPTNLPGAIISATTAANVGPAALALPAGGYAAKKTADSLLQSQLETARKTIAMPAGRKELVDALMQQPNKLAAPSAASQQIIDALMRQW